jgi:hypothetical protein
MRERLGLLLKQRRLSRDDIKAVLQVRKRTKCSHGVVFGGLSEMLEPGFRLSRVGIFVKFPLMAISFSIFINLPLTGS